MANQPKKYKKFVATAATATLVASAIVPVASADELAFSDMAGYDADTIALVEDLAADGIIVGADGKFNPQGDVSRKHAVLIIGRYLESLGLEASEGVKQFDDVDGKDAEFARLALLVRDLGIFNGNDLGQLNPSGKFTRQNMALVLDRVFQVTTGKTLKEIADEQGLKGNVADINKVKAEAKEAVLAANALGLSKVSTFNPEGTAKRVHFAQFFYVAAPILEENLDLILTVDSAIEAVEEAIKALPAASTVTATNAAVAQKAVDTLTKAVKALEDAVKEAGTDLTDAQKTAAAKAVTDGKAAAKAVQDAIDATVPVEVSSVSAINATTLELTGTGLKNLKAEEVTFDGNKVSAITASADGKTATVTISGKLLPDVEYIAKVGNKEFKVKYTLKADSVTVVKATFDDDRADQKVTVRLNGQNTDVDYLRALGYSVNFTAIDPKNNTAANIFAPTTLPNPNVASSTSGKLGTGLTKGDYEVQVTISKDGTSMVSTKETITIANIDAATSSINDVKFAVGGTGSATYNTTFTGTEYVLNSTTLVVGESASVSKLKANVNGVESTVPYASIDVKSSNPAVISVASNGVLTANGDGTATITVKVGTVEKAFTFTVASKARELAKVTTDKSTLSVVNGGSSTVEFKTFDQYGDPFAVVTGATGNSAIVEEIPTVDGTPIVTLDIDTDDANSIGVKKFTVTAAKSGKETVIFRENKNNKVIGSLFIDSTVANTVATKKLELVKVKDQSEDNALDVANTKDKTVTYKLSKFNNSNQYVGAQDLNGYKVEVVDGTIASAQFYNTGTSSLGTASTTTANAIITGSANDDQIFVTGLKAGSTDVLVKDATGVVVDRLTVTVSKNVTEVQSINFKSVPTIGYSGEIINLFDVLDTVKSTGDDVVNGVILTRASQSKVRLAENTSGIIANDKAGVSQTVTEGDLYLDEDNDAQFSAGDVKLGKFTASLTSDSNAALTTAFGAFSTAKLLETTAGTGLATTAQGQKGTVLIKFTAILADNTTKTISSAVTVDVK